MLETKQKNTIESFTKPIVELMARTLFLFLTFVDYWWKSDRTINLCWKCRSQVHTLGFEENKLLNFFISLFVAVIGGAVVGLLCAILVVMFIVYRIRKKDEGSYPLEEMKRCPTYNPYMKPTHREFFAWAALGRIKNKMVTERV